MKAVLAENSLVKQAEAQIESRLKGPDARQNYMKIVVSAMRVAMKDGPKGLLAQLKDSENPVEDAVKGAIGLVGMLRTQAKGVMPMDVATAATMTLILQALDFLERMGKLKITPELLNEATKLFVETILPQAGVTPEKLARLVGGVKGVIDDPEKVSRVFGRQGPSQLGA